MPASVSGTLTLQEILGLFLLSLNLHHGDDYGRGFFTMTGRIQSTVAIIVDIPELPDAEAQPIALGVEFGGRRFPQYWVEPDTGTSRLPHRVVRRLTERSEHRNLPWLLANTLRGLVRWSELSPTESDRQRIVEAYVDSLARLNQCRRDVDNLIRVACEVNLEFRQASADTYALARERVMSQKLDEMLRAAHTDWMPVRNVVDARLVSQPVEALRGQLHTALQEAIADFAKQFFDILAKLVDANIFGLVEWLPNHCVGYHFFKQIVIQSVTGRSTTEMSRLFTSDRDGIVTMRHEVTGSNQHRLARHEHYVMHAVQTTIGNSRVVMPPDVAHLVQQIPDWLYPFVSVIDGHLFRERIVEQDLRQENWADVKVEDRPTYGDEPAVIIGPYVLTGWGPREIEREQSRRIKVKSWEAQELATLRWPYFLGAAVALGIVSLYLLGRTMFGAGGGFFVVLATSACIGSVWQMASEWAVMTERDQPKLLARYLTAASAFGLFLLQWCVAKIFMPGLPWLIPTLLLSGITACLTLSIKFMNSTFPNVNRGK